MNVFSWRNFVLSSVASLSIFAGCPNAVQACCLSWLCGCFGGQYDGSYGAGYYGAPAANYGGCNSCGYANTYAGMASNYGCSSCGGSCGVQVPTSTQPVPDHDSYPRDKFQPGGRSGKTDTGRDRDFGGSPDDSNSTRGRGNTRNTTPKNDGFGGRLPRDLDSNDENYQRPLKPNSQNDDLFDGKTKKPSIPPGRKPAGDATEEDPDSFGGPRTQKTNRPVIVVPGAEDETASQPTVIPKAQPAPTKEPAEGELESDPANNEGLNLDNKKTSSAVAPRARLALKGQIQNPSLVRMKVRPKKQWFAEPELPKLAKQ